MLYRISWFLVVLSLSIWAKPVTADPALKVNFGQAIIQVGEQRLTVEYAGTFEQRARGLMYRTELCDSCGMLFEFEYPREAGFWMKNTLIPLDIAYLDKRGVITDIKPMYPLVLDPVPSSKPVLYALEMNQGWFAANDVVVGDRITIISQQEAP